MARRTPETTAKFLAYDPGLMPGTGLARERSAIEQFAWRRLLPLSRLFMDGVSSPERSSETLFKLIESRGVSWATGDHVFYTGRKAPESAAASDPSLANKLHDASVRLSGMPKAA